MLLGWLKNAKLRCGFNLYDIEKAVLEQLNANFGGNEGVFGVLARAALGVWVWLKSKML